MPDTPEKRKPENKPDRDRIDQLRLDMKADHKRFEKRMLKAIAILSVGVIISIVLGRIETGNRVDDVNQGRVETTYESCLSTNDRHSNAIIKLDIGLLSALVPLDRQAQEAVRLSKLTLIQLERRISDISNRKSHITKNDTGTPQQLRQTHDFTVLLLDALAPVRVDCKAYAENLVKT